MRKSKLVMIVAAFTLVAAMVVGCSGNGGDGNGVNGGNGGNGGYVPTPAAFSGSNLSVEPAEVIAGEAVTISVSLAKIGGSQGSHNVVLNINGVQEEAKSVTIAAGASESATFSVTREVAGIYTVNVGSLSGSFTVTPEVVVMVLTSPAFQDGEAIPVKYSGEGQDISPELTWSGVPNGTQSFVLIMDDPDAPGGVFTHWVIFNIPADSRELEEAVPTQLKLPSGALQGRNDFGTIGYGGPYPPPGSLHHYNFTLYALDDTLDLQAGATKQQVLNAIQGHILAQVQLVGTFQT